MQSPNLGGSEVECERGSQAPPATAPVTHSVTLSTLSLDDAIRRFEREAVHAVCDTGRYRCRFYSWVTGRLCSLFPAWRKASGRSCSCPLS